MHGGIHLYHPLNTLKQVADRIWIADGDIIHMHFPLGVKVPFSTRMTVVRLTDGSLWCHSPIALNTGLLRELDALGEVRHLVSPNRIHYAHIASWKGIYPKATAWASPGVRERAQSQHIETAFDADLIENFETGKFDSHFWAGAMRLAGIADPDGKAPVDYRATFRDRKAARESLAHMLAWQPERIILAHGRCYDTNGTEELRRAFRWLD